MGRYDQHFDELLPLEKTAVAFLREAFDLDEQNARKSLGMFGLDGPRHLVKIADLSGGQKARVVLAALSLQAPHVLVLDEPVCLAPQIFIWQGSHSPLSLSSNASGPP